MQVARNFFLSRKKTYTRKLNEILLALKIERDLNKQEILELYLNKIYLGHRAYGVGAAAQVYYGTSVDRLTLAQTTMIAGLPKAPSRHNPITNPKRALERRDYVLGRMLQQGFIEEEEYRQAIAIPATARLHAANIEVEAPYIAEMVRSEMVSRYGDQAYTNGFSVITTVDSRLQQAANSAVRQALQAYDMRHGYRGPEKQLQIDANTDDEQLQRLISGYRSVGDLEPALVTRVEKRFIDVFVTATGHIEIPWQGLEWARPYINENRRGGKPGQAAEIVKPGDLVRILRETPEKGEPYWRLAQVPAVEGALISLEPDDGGIVALVGGYDFYSSKFNRATQAKRQPGSGFKAFIYSAALEAGFTPASLINDAPVVFDDPSLERAWRPKNYSGKFFGPTRLRYALTKSRNLVSIRLLRAMGIEHALKHVARFGFNPDQLPHNLSLALGSATVTPLQMAAGYAILANGGYRVEPYFILRTEDSHHQTLYQANPPRVCENCPEAGTGGEETGEPDIQPDSERPDAPPIAPRVISPQNDYLMNSMMRDVITRGTARKARALGRKDLAGKTGTTNDQKDAWFNGFNRSLVAITWVGFDSAKPLGRGEVGGRAALPAWMAYMEEALGGVKEIPLKMPPGIITVRINPTTGERAGSGEKDAIFEVFRREYAPKARPQTNRTTRQQKSVSDGADSAAEEDPF
jgi:penicillin-binding protein 1A